VNFLDAMEAEARVTGEARVVRGGGSLVYCEGRVWDESGKTGATCTGIYRIFRRR
jgi:acyl-coenzyme A thioesterase PaaI-like protein